MTQRDILSRSVICSGGWKIMLQALVVTAADRQKIGGSIVLFIIPQFGSITWLMMVSHLF